jgi:hypothetical protein
MSSGISTNRGPADAGQYDRLVPPNRGSAEGGRVPPKRGSAEAEALQPWQLFTLAGLIGATIVVFLSRGQSPAAIIVLSCAVFAAAFVGVAALRTFLPFTRPPEESGAEMLGGRTRAALEREKTLALRTIKELEFDRGMGKVSEKDFSEMSARLRARAARLMRQLDAGSLYREEIEREVERRLGDAGPAAPDAGSAPRKPAHTAPAHTAACASCDTRNDPDARFCKNCGARLGAL